MREKTKKKQKNTRQEIQQGTETEKKSILKMLDKLARCTTIIATTTTITTT